jgi:NitT/TauT family transport system permease protein
MFKINLPKISLPKLSFPQKIIPVIAVLLFWYVGSQYSSPLFLPEPIKVLQGFESLTENGMLQNGLLASLLRITVATVLSAMVSIPIGLLVANYKFADNMITPVTSFMRFMPVTAFYPLLMMWVGIDEIMKVTFLFCATFFYFLPSVILAVKEVSQDLIDTAYTMGMSKVQVMLQVVLPAALPGISQSFLMMYGIGWTYVIIAEVVNAHYGLGHIINISSARGRTDLVFVGLFTIIAISYLFDTIGNYSIKKIFKWKFAREIRD